MSEPEANRHSTPQGGFRLNRCPNASAVSAVLRSRAVAAAVLGAVSIAFGAEPAFVLQRQHKPVPAHLVYRALFHHMAGLQRIADSLDAREPGKGQNVRTYYRTQIGLSAEAAGTLQRVAVACDDAVAQQDRKALAVVERSHAKHPGGKLAPGETPPGVPGELLQLQQERDRILRGCIARVRSSMASKDHRLLDEYVTKRFARRLTNLTLRSAGPGQQPARTEAQPASEPVGGVAR